MRRILLVVLPLLAGCVTTDLIPNGDKGGYIQSTGWHPIQGQQAVARADLHCKVYGKQAVLLDDSMSRIVRFTCQ